MEALIVIAEFASSHKENVKTIEIIFVKSRYKDQRTTPETSCVLWNGYGGCKRRRYLEL